MRKREGRTEVGDQKSEISKNRMTEDRGQQKPEGRRQRTAKARGQREEGRGQRSAKTGGQIKKQGDWRFLASRLPGIPASQGIAFIVSFE
jgi:hypothetical protein